jgi:hypothetical protein
MPSSRVSTIPYVISVVKQLQPRSILDVGVGFGKWGYLFREFTDIIASEAEPSRYSKPAWRTRIEGIEGFAPYIHDGHRFAYDKVHLGDAANLLPQLGEFDLIFLGDIIEHFTIREGMDILRHAIRQRKQCVLLTTPRFQTHQAASCGNELERHRSLWRPKEFREAGFCRIALADRATFVVAYPSPACSTLRLGPERAGPRPLIYRALGKIRRLLQGPRPPPAYGSCRGSAQWRGAGAPPGPGQRLSPGPGRQGPPAALPAPFSLSRLI